MTYDSIMNWTAAGPAHCTGSMVFTPTYPGDCEVQNVPGGAHAAVKMDAVVFDSVGAPTGNGAWAAPAATQDFYTYANATDAQSAFNYITHDILNEDAQFDGSHDAVTNPRS